jgi:hypothetical protein
MNIEPEKKPEIDGPKSESPDGDPGVGLGSDGQASKEVITPDVWRPQRPIEFQELNDLRDLVQLCRQNSPPEPSEVAWGNLLAGVKARLSIPRPVETTTKPEVKPSKLMKNHRPWRWVRNGFWGAAAAAAIFLVVMSQRNLRDTDHPRVKIQPGPVPPPPDLVADVPILDSNDFTLVSMKASDADLLLVGKPLVTEPLVLMEPDDVDLESVEPDEDDFVPVFRTKSGSPMIISPRQLKKNKEPAEK